MLRRADEMQAKTLNHAVKATTKKRPRLSRKKRELIKLLRRWSEEGDKEEQRDTWECLRKALGED